MRKRKNNSVRYLGGQDRRIPMTRGGMNFNKRDSSFIEIRKKDTSIYMDAYNPTELIILC